MSLADLLRGNAGRTDLSLVDGLYLQRAKRELGDRLAVGRDEIRTALFAEDRSFPNGEVAVRAVAPELLVSSNGDLGQGTKRHHWLTLENERIAGEIIVGHPAAEQESGAEHVFRPFGERRAGEGQFSIGKHALLPNEVSPTGQMLADALHAAWNALDFLPLRSLYAADVRWSGPAGRNAGPDGAIEWISELRAELPASTLLFERVIEAEQAAAFLWRLVADEGERRLWMRGSTILRVCDGRITEEDTVADEGQLDLHRRRPILDL